MLDDHAREYASSAPFFLYLSMHNVHEPYQVSGESVCECQVCQMLMFVSTNSNSISAGLHVSVELLGVVGAHFQRAPTTSHPKHLPPPFLAPQAPQRFIDLYNASQFCEQRQTLQVPQAYTSSTIHAHIFAHAHTRAHTHTHTTHNTQYTIHNTQYTIHNTQYTIHTHARTHVCHTCINTHTRAHKHANKHTHIHTHTHTPDTRHTPDSHTHNTTHDTRHTNKERETHTSARTHSEMQTDAHTRARCRSHQKTKKKKKRTKRNITKHKKANRTKQKNRTKSHRTKPSQKHSKLPQAMVSVADELVANLVNAINVS